MQITDKRNQIKNHSQRLVADIREYVQLQKKDWQLVPWLALQADGRGGYSEHYSYAYHYGLWFVYSKGTAPMIDCATGKLVYFDRTPLGDHVVLGLAKSLDAITAKSVIARLQHQATHGDFSGHTKGELDQRAAWRVDLAKQLHLTPCYFRRKTADAA